MTLELLKQELSELVLDDDTLKTRRFGTTTIAFFLETFGECNLTYDSLSKKALELDNGWLVIFDEWKEKGYIN